VKSSSDPMEYLNRPLSPVSMKLEARGGIDGESPWASFRQILLEVAAAGNAPISAERVKAIPFSVSS
jgi:hypothetical protein